METQLPSSNLAAKTKTRMFEKRFKRRKVDSSCHTHEPSHKQDYTAQTFHGPCTADSYNTTRLEFGGQEQRVPQQSTEPPSSDKALSSWLQNQLCTNLNLHSISTDTGYRAYFKTRGKLQTITYTIAKCLLIIFLWILIVCLGYQFFQCLRTTLSKRNDWESNNSQGKQCILF